MGNKRQTSVWLDPDVDRYIQDNDINVTGLVNDSVHLMMRNESPEQLRKDEQEFLRRAASCRQRYESLENNGRKETIVENIRDDTRRQLLEEWVSGNRGDVVDDMLQINWLNGPKRVERVKRAGFKSPLECLEWIRNQGV